MSGHERRDLSFKRLCLSSILLKVIIKEGRIEERHQGRLNKKDAQPPSPISFKDRFINRPWPEDSKRNERKLSSLINL